MASFLVGGDVYSIASRGLSAEFCPDMGGRMLSLTASAEIDVLVPLAPQRFDVTDWPRAGAYPLIPYHNRLASAALTVAGKRYSLPPHPAAAPHTLHGPSHTRPWEPRRHDTARLVMGLDSSADDHWPWDYEAQQDFQIEGSVLVLTMTLTNRDRRPMPAGLGWHPYFASAQAVAADASARWPHRADYLPTGERIDSEIQVLRYLPPTCYAEGWRHAHVSGLGRARAVMTASDVFRFLVVHRGDPAHVCVEPVTHVPNAWNLDRDDVGARLLAPGETLEGRIRLEISF